MPRPSWRHRYGRERRCRWDGNLVSSLQWRHPSCVFLGIHCVSDWDGGVWTAGVEACHGGLQQVQVSLSICCKTCWSPLVMNGCSGVLWFVFQDHLREAGQRLHWGKRHSVPPARRGNISQHPLLCLQHWWVAPPVRARVPLPHTDFWGTIGGDSGHNGSGAVSRCSSSSSLYHEMFCIFRNLGDQNAINDLMQMRLTGGGGGMMAEKLEVNMWRTLTGLVLKAAFWLLSPFTPEVPEWIGCHVDSSDILRSVLSLRPSLLTPSINKVFSLRDFHRLDGVVCLGNTLWSWGLIMWGESQEISSLAYSQNSPSGWWSR